jgi:hypothetical protein
MLVVTLHLDIYIKRSQEKCNSQGSKSHLMLSEPILASYRESRTILLLCEDYALEIPVSPS